MQEGFGMGSEGLESRLSIGLEYSDSRLQAVIIGRVIGYGFAKCY